jgi:hypothetical protein
MWTPVRVVCRNTLVTGEDSSTVRLSTFHVAGVVRRTSAALQVATALQRAQNVKHRLEALARVHIRNDDVVDVFERVYGQYRPRSVDLGSVRDLVSDEAFELVARPREGQNAYVDRLIETTRAAYDRFCDEFPAFSGTAYALYQAVVESADHRKGRRSAVESAVVGDRAGEKVRAWQVLTGMLDAGVSPN